MKRFVCMSSSSSLKWLYHDDYYRWDVVDTINPSKGNGSEYLIAFFSFKKIILPHCFIEILFLILKYSVREYCFRDQGGPKQKKITHNCFHVFIIIRSSCQKVGKFFFHIKYKYKLQNQIFKLFLYNWIWSYQIIIIEYLKITHVLFISYRYWWIDWLMSFSLLR